MTTADTIPAGWEVHTLPSGAIVYYRDSDHSYWGEVRKNGDVWGGVQAARLTGVTTAIKPFDHNPEMLIGWAARKTREGVAALAVEYMESDFMPEWLLDADSIETHLAASNLRHNDVRDDAAARGTNVHKHALHALATGRPVPAFDDLSVEEVGYAKGVAGWWLDEQPDVIASEFLVADLDLRVAGRPDLLCRLSDGRLAVVDAKTSGFIPSKFAVQLSAYAHLALVSGYEAPEVGVILQVAEDGAHTAIPVDLDHEDFLAALDVYRRAGRITGALRKAARA